MNNDLTMADKTADDQTRRRGRAAGTLRSIAGLLDFIACVYLVSLFFHGDIPGRQQLREAVRQVYTFMLDPKNLLVTSFIGVRLSLYGISRVLRFRSATKNG